jgi:polar amino acid transport system permease protein
VRAPSSVPAVTDLLPIRTRRQAYDRRQRLRGSLIGAASTLVVLAAIVLIVPRLDGWDRVQRTFFDGETFGDAFPEVARAFWLDVRIFLICTPTIVIVGMAIALARSVRSPVLFPLRLLAALYVDIVRGVPILLWLFLIGFGGAGLLNRRSVGAGPFEVGTLLFLGGLALVTNRHVVLPQAVRRVVPPLMNDFISLQKDVSLVSVLGPIEALRRADVLQDRLFNFTPFVVAAVLFLSVSIPLTRTADYLLQKERRAMTATAVR